jgi:hypothetical protein
MGGVYLLGATPGTSGGLSASLSPAQPFIVPGGVELEAVITTSGAVRIATAFP